MPKIPVDEAPAGLHMDAAVAKALGWADIRNGREADCELAGRPPGERYWGHTVPSYSTDIAAAWEVITEARKIGFGFTISDNANRFAEHIDCRFWRLRDDMRRGIAIEGVAPLAICRAFLQANGVEHVEVPE